MKIILILLIVIMTIGLFLALTVDYIKAKKGKRSLFWESDNKENKEDK